MRGSGACGGGLSEERLTPVAGVFRPDIRPVNAVKDSESYSSVPSIHIRPSRIAYVATREYSHAAIGVRMSSTLSRFDYIDAARSTAQSFVEMTRRVDNPETRLGGAARWTVGDCVGHVACEPSRYLDLARGEASWPCRTHELFDVYAKQIANVPTRDVGSLCGKLLDDLDELLDLVSHFGARVPMMQIDSGLTVRADASLGILIGEFAVRGHDIARATGQRWELDPALTPLVVRGHHALLPVWRDEGACREHHATYDVRLRGYDERCILEFTGGALEVNPAEHREPDVHISIDPVACLLAGYGRMSLLRAAVTGRAMVWGAKPWLATGLVRRFGPTVG